MSYYHSNWNRNNRPGFKKILASILAWPKYVWQNIRTQKSWQRRIGMTAAYGGAALMLLGSITFALVSLSLPDPNKLNDREVAQSTKIYDREGQTLLYEIHGEAKRTLVTLNDIPDYAQQATIAIEDKDFYKNTGIDWKGVGRGVFGVFTTGSLEAPGGSTITQQFVRNAILTKEKNTFQKATRKIKEIVLAIEINQAFSKDEILQLYLNEIPYGQNAYGIEAASQTYFNKSAKNITLAEAAYLAALPQSPSRYSNPVNRQLLDARHERILDLMAEQGYITTEERDTAKKEVVTFSKIKNQILAPHFVLYIVDQLTEKYGEKTLQEGGLKVITTLDWNMQQIAEKAVTDGVARNEKAWRAENASLVAQDPRNGQILAMVGSRDYFDDEHDGQVNIAIRELQPGSSIKPYIYAAAFKEGMNPATMLMDVKTSFGSFGGQDYSPNNYNGQQHGPVNIRKALAGSLNISAVKTLSLVGVQDAINTAKDLGITSNITADKCGLSLVLGGCEIKLIDHVAAMSVFANMGIKQDQISILRVEDSTGEILEEFEETEGKKVIDPQIAYQIVDIMSDNNARAFVFGQQNRLTLPDRIVAAKTGTTNEWRDAWTLGYTPSLVAGVWVGNNDHSKMAPNADGSVVAAPIWNQFMREVTKGTPVEQFIQPEGIQRIMVDTISGKLPTEYTPNTKQEVFATFNIPQNFDDVHLPVKINQFNNKLANDRTPPEYITTKVYTVLHSERPDNPNWELPVRFWSEANGYEYPPTEQDDGSVNPGLIPQSITFVTPINNQEITTLPFGVQVSINGVQVTSVDLMLDNEFIESKTSDPYSFVVGSASPGKKTLTAVARLDNGGAIQNSIQININTNNNQPQ